MIGFNRNIVECKVTSLFRARPIDRVLIETLWNVKVINVADRSRADISFNRNIVECKEEVLAGKWGNGDGFNRNIVECKASSTYVESNYRLSFNRNIVECKGL